jgi:hypothetical protein
VIQGRFGLCILGNLHERTKCTAKQPSEEIGPRPCHLGCGCTQGEAAPCLACMATTSGRWASGWAWAPLAVVPGSGICMKVGFSNSFDCVLLRIRLQHCAFSSLSMHFYLFLGMCPAKHVSPKTSGIRSKYMHMCQSLFISPIFGL